MMFFVLFFGAIKTIVNIRTIFHTIIEMDSELFTKFCVKCFVFFGIPFFMDIKRVIVEIFFLEFIKQKNKNTNMLQHLQEN